MDSSGDNPNPNIIKPDSPLNQPGEPAGAQPQTPSASPEQSSPAMPIFSSPSKTIQPLAATPEPDEPPSPPTPQPASQPATPLPPLPQQAPLPPVDTNKLFQADTNLPQMNTNQGNFVVDNRPPGKLKRIFRSKKITAIIAAQIIVILLVVGGVFGYYLPNRPGAVWNTGLDRSGQALDKLLAQATGKQQLESFKKSQIDASLSVNAEGGSFKGDFTGRFDQSKADGNLNVSVDTGGNSEKLAMKYISILASGATYPDFYIQLNGIKALGADSFVPGVSDYDGKWISVDSNYFKSLGLPVPTPGQNSDSNKINAGNVSELIRAVSSVSKDYILTSNKDRAVIKQVKFVGKEKTDGISTYHYIAAIDRDHAKDYCKALYEKVSTTAIYKNFNSNNQDKINKSKESDIKACQDYDTNIKTNFDLWVDAKYKLIHKIRIPDDTNKQAYTEVGQNYKGGDDISFFVNYHDGKSPVDINLTFSTNTKSIDSKGELTVKGGKGSSVYDGKVTFDIKPLSGDLNIEKPANSIPIQEIFNKYGIDPGAFTQASSGQQAQAKDADRKADINAIYSQIEVYWAGNNGYYPTLGQINDASWRSANLQGFNSDSLKPSDSSATGLASAASSDQYGYSTSGCSSRGCAKFTLTALLSNGQKYVKTDSRV